MADFLTGERKRGLLLVMLLIEGTVAVSLMLGLPANSSVQGSLLLVLIWAPAALLAYGWISFHSKSEAPDSRAPLPPA